jgi:hypothetical protein
MFLDRELLERAAIVEPPLVQLIRRLRTSYPKLSKHILTTDAFCQLFLELDEAPSTMLEER